MRKCIASLVFLAIIWLSASFSPRVFAADPVTTGVTGLGVGAAVTLPSDGSWITDPEVTKIGKNAARAGMLLDWTLRDYQWSFVKNGDTNPLIPFWLTMQRIVYALFLFVVLVTAFILIVTRGRSLSARRFLPRFFMVVLLVTFSFSLVQFLYQIIDIFQGFFLKNPQGNIISSRDLLYVGFDYQSFQGLRVFGQSFDESALISLLLVKLTSFTYYVMVILLIFRKIILWFFIIISPVFPLLLLFYPLRNTAKIWVGEFFRWLLYAPLFAIFLSGLVKLWQTSLPLLFNFTKVSDPSTVVYPTAVNILLGGPQQHISQVNSVNLPDTFALYVVALIMLWTVIILPFILLQIFLDYFMSVNYRDNPLLKQVYTLMNNRPLIPPPLPPGSPAPAGQAGLARTLPLVRRFEGPKRTGLTRSIPTSTSISERQQISRPVTTTINNQTQISRLTNLSIPTMRDIARFEKEKLSNRLASQQEIERVKSTLLQIANPQMTSTSKERERYQSVRERLVIEGQKGNQTATNILNAATTYNTYHSVSKSSQSSQLNQQLIQNLANPEKIVDKTEKEKIIHIREQLQSAANTGNELANVVLSVITQTTTAKVTSLSHTLEALSHPEKVADEKERQQYTSLREKISQASNAGNPLAQLVVSSLEKSTSIDEVKMIQTKLLEAQAQGNPLATEILTTVTSKESTSEQQLKEVQTTLEEANKKGDPLAAVLLPLLTSQSIKQQEAPLSAAAKLKTGAFPVVNRVQQVSLDDYEAVKKMWRENYQNLEVPQDITGQKTRKQWITSDIADIEQTISLLTSSNPADVEEGMKKVSDILPFLLIGGFSQTEIIAYLKAKMEAGKQVAESIGSKEEEEETLLNAAHAAKAVTSHMTTSMHVDEESSSSTSQSEAPTITNNFTTNNTYTTTVVQPVSSSSNTSLLHLAQLPLITMRDIVQFETTQGSATEKAAFKKIQATLSGISNPEQLASNEERDRFVRLRQEIVAENRKGNPLAGMILAASLMSASGKKPNTQLLPKGRVPALPKQNKLQQVSLEDYEMVKKMWEDNYSSQSSLEGKTKEEWLQDDLRSISETINLLSSENEQDITSGMEKVGEILPFLLLGGFSKQEIIGYLKAKMEAGKTVLSRVESVTEDNDFQQVVTGKQGKTASADAIELPTPESQDPTFETKNLSQDKGSLPEQVRLPLPSLKDIAVLETHQQSGSPSLNELLRTLRNIASPERIKDKAEKDRITLLREALVKQANSGDVTAQTILNAVGNGNTAKQSSRDDVSQFLITLRSVLDPSLVENVTTRQDYTATRDMLVKARQAGDDRAVTLMRLVDTISQEENEAIMNMLRYVGNPAQIVDEKDRSKYTEFRQILEKEAPSHSLASMIMQATKGDMSPVSANKIRVQLLEASMRQEPLATSITNNFITLPQSTMLEVKSIYKEITKKGSKDPLITAIISLLNKQPVSGKNRRTLQFPQQNRTQKTSVDDYEAIKKLWYEMYIHGEVPKDSSGEEQTREEWVALDKKDVEEVINLLSSDNLGNQQLGMERVGDILPFLLIGGFSQAEVLDYLKAKKEAAVLAFQTLTVIKPELVDRPSEQKEPVLQSTHMQQSDTVSSNDE